MKREMSPHLLSSSGRINVLAFVGFPLNKQIGCPFGGSFHFCPACMAQSSCWFEDKGNEGIEIDDKNRENLILKNIMLSKRTKLILFGNGVRGEIWGYKYERQNYLQIRNWICFVKRKMENYTKKKLYKKVDSFNNRTQFDFENEKVQNSLEILYILSLLLYYSHSQPKCVTYEFWFWSLRYIRLCLQSLVLSFSLFFFLK